MPRRELLRSGRKLGRNCGFFEETNTCVGKSKI
jgi:hypothetical protein